MSPSMHGAAGAAGLPKTRLANLAGPGPDGVSADADDSTADVTAADDSGMSSQAPPEPPLPTARRVVLRLVNRWVPGSWRIARVDPGRPGAQALAAVAGLAAVVAAVGVWWQRPVPEAAPPLVAVAAASPTGLAASSTARAAGLVISVVGKVGRPGLVTLPDGARVADALAAAGGPLAGTDLFGLNLARKLADGEQVAVGLPAPETADPAAGTLRPGVPLDLNSATVAQLDTLPGVGPVTAQRIVEWRRQHGRFSSVDQLREIGGIGQSRLARLRELVTV